MKITGKIFDNLNEDYRENFTNLGDALNFLIQDEREAIAGYKNVLSRIKPNINEKQYSILENTLSHIISEEEEHIKELQELKDIFLV